MSSAPKIALISAVSAAIPPAETALHASLPEATVWNILDDRLLSDADDEGGLNDGLRARMRRLIDHAVAEHADGVLLTCSLYGPIVQEIESEIPVLAPDEAAFADIVAAGYESVLVVASFAGGRDDSVKRLKSAVRDAGGQTRVAGIAVPEAMTATRAGDRAALASALIEACLLRSAEVDAIFLAQYSLAPVGDDLQAAVGIPVISGPKSSAHALQRLLSDEVTT